MKTPAISVVCVIIGCFALLIGGAMLAFGFANLSHPAPDTGSFMTTAFALCFSSVIWFAIARAIELLAEIEYNTRAKK